MTCSELAKLLGGDVRGDEVLCPGPGHSNADRSLSVKPDRDAADGFLVYSFAGDDPILCRDHVRTKLGLPPFEPKKKNGKARTGATWTMLAEHIYRDEHGAPYLLVKKCRDGAGKKQFPQYHWDGTQWIKGKPPGPRIPYRLPELLAAPRTTIAYVCEGEKDCDNLAKIGFVATTASEGASAKWTPELTEFFRGRRVVILPDADEPGRKHGEKVARAVSSVATSVKIVDLFPERNDGSDVSDWLETDRVGVKLIKAVSDAPHWEPGRTAETSTDTAADEELIANSRRSPGSSTPSVARARPRRSASRSPSSTRSSSRHAASRNPGRSNAGASSRGNSRCLLQICWMRCARRTRTMPSFPIMARRPWHCGRCTHGQSMRPTSRRS